MVALTSDVRWDVIKSLQSTRDRFPNGSQTFDQYDKAISLALSPDRMANQYLGRNVKRDAKRILRRTEQAIPFSTVAKKGDGYNLLDRYNGRRISTITKVAGPLENLIAQDLLEAILDRTSFIEHGRDCLEGLLSGKTINQIAHKIGISRHKVEYAISKIRSTTKELVEEVV